MEGKVAPDRRVTVAASVLSAFLVAAGLSTVPDVAAAPAELQGLSRSAVVKAPRDAMWFGQTDASALCSLIPGCASVTKSGKGYRMRLVGYAPALGEVQQDVDMNVVKKVAPRLIRMRLSAKSALGSMSGVVDLKLKKKTSTKTLMTLNVARAKGSGILGDVMLPFLADNLQTGVSASADALNRSRKSSGITVRATTPKKSASKKRIPVSVRVLFKDPRVQPTPVASGTVRIVDSKTKTVCKTKVKKSRAKCTFIRGKRKPGQLRAVVTGRFSNGFQVWHSSPLKVKK